MGFSETMLENSFMKGIKLDIHLALWSLGPRGLSEMMELAQLVNDEKGEAFSQVEGRWEFPTQ